MGRGLDHALLCVVCLCLTCGVVCVVNFVNYIHDRLYMEH